MGKQEGILEGIALGKQEGILEGIALGKQEGIAEGIARGIAAGEEKMAKKFANQLILLGQPLEEICKLTGLSMAVVEKLRLENELGPGL